MNNTLLCILFSISSYGCIEQRDVITSRCSIDDDNYVTTEFDCGGGNYVQRIVCGRTRHQNRARCTTDILVREYQMGHCRSYNICD